MVITTKVLRGKNVFVAEYTTATTRIAVFNNNVRVGVVRAITYTGKKTLYTAYKGRETVNNMVKFEGIYFIYFKTKQAAINALL